ncbi:hypothetical protein ACFRQM_34365 [Streptomyces sp. NPDC056831]|uniref:hypothetical protein n=1 Tax=Streptomyces sp. NPDC056831 TaxID=3345954 RepID=UPI0036BF39E2
MHVLAPNDVRIAERASHDCRREPTVQAPHVGTDVEESDRGADAVEERLRDWSEPQNTGDTILYWTGHGESDGDQSALLAHARSPRPLATGGMTPQQLVSYLTAREAHRKGKDGWAIVIIDACKSARFVELMSSDVYRNPTGARNFLLVATSGKGNANLGTFRKVLTTVLTVTFRADDSIDLWHLATELRRNLDGCPVEAKTVPGRAMLHRRVPVLTQTSLDQLAEIETVLDKLSDDERRHFVPKASGAELGEQAWYFEGRHEERHQILTWLDTVRSGLLVITGAAGSGKSALLGHILVRTQPELRRVLEAAGQLTPLPTASPQPRDPFDAVIHLTGATPQDLVARIAHAAGLNAPPANQELNAQSDWLITGMRGRAQPFTLLVDALDEAHLPLTTADRILRRLAALPMTRYALRRLTAAGHHGVLQAEQRQIDQAADAIGALDREFLYARLAVHEIIQARSLDNLESLLDSDHRQLFRRAVERLARLAPANRPLLEALGLAQGQGLPLHDGIWATTAAALNDEATGITMSDADIEALTKTAAPYLMLDTESGQSVYRLAHRTFAEHFARPSAYDHRHHLITERLAAQADAHLSASPPNAYLVQHLASHAALGGSAAWEALARHIRVLDHMNPSAVAAEALRTAYGRADLPPPVAATLSAHHLLAQALPEDRSAVRALVTARLTGELPPRTPRSPWAVRWTHLPATHLYITLSGHTGTVRALVAVPLADGRTLLASAGADRMVRLWDPTTGRQVGEAYAAHPNEVHALAAVQLEDGRTLLATIGNGRAKGLWDPNTGAAVGNRFSGRRAVAAIPLADGRVLLATGSTDNRVGLWDATNGRSVGQSLTGHAASVHAVAAVPLADGRVLLATGSADHTVRLWAPTTGRTAISESGTAHTRALQAVTAVSVPGQATILATVSRDERTNRTVHLWGAQSGCARNDLPTSHTEAVLTLAAVPLVDGRTLLATAGIDRTIRLCDAANGRSTGQPLRGHTAPVRAITTVPGNDGRTRLVTVGDDRTMRLWHPETGQLLDQLLTGHRDAVHTVTAIRMPNGRTLLATAGADQTVRLWDASNGNLLHCLTGHTEAIHAVTAVPRPNRPTLLATASHDGTVRLWDPYTGRPAGHPLIGHTRPVRGIAVVRLPDGNAVLATAGDDRTVRLWHPVTGALLRTLPLGVAVTTLTAFDGTMLCVGSESGLLAIELDTPSAPPPPQVSAEFAGS